MTPYILYMVMTFQGESLHLQMPYEDKEKCEFVGRHTSDEWRMKVPGAVIFWECKRNHG